MNNSQGLTTRRRKPRWLNYNKLFVDLVTIFGDYSIDVILNKYYFVIDIPIK